MSSETTFKVPLTKILELSPHSNADRLELARVYGFQVIVPKGVYKPGDDVIYVPIDSILPKDLEEALFPPDAKIKLHNHRVRQIRIRGLASQGMLINPAEIGVTFKRTEVDLREQLNIIKYEPPARPGGIPGAPGQKKVKRDNPNFHKYNGVDNIKWFPNFFKEDEEVVIQEKLHGTNCRAGILPYVPRTLWQRIKKWFGLAPPYENVYGSNNVEISSKHNWNGGWYSEDIYGATLKRWDVFYTLKRGEVVYGEIVGPKIQKNYEYGLDELHFVLFDVKVLQADGKLEYLNPEEVEIFAKARGFEMVPVLYRGKFTQEVAYKLSRGASVYAPVQKVREGVVIKSRFGYDGSGSKRALKYINEDYLDKADNTDYH